MNHREARKKRDEVIELLNYVGREGIRSLHLCYGLDRNLERLNKSESDIVDKAPVELKDLEAKFYELGKIDMPENDYEAIILKGKSIADPDDIDKYDKLLAEFMEFLNESDPVEIYYLDRVKCEDLPIDLIHSRLLNSLFFPK